MKRFVEGDDRKQVAPLPECVDDYIGGDNPVRVIDAFVDELYLAELGFNGVKPATTGLPSYDPGVMLKIYIYGYLNRIPSSPPPGARVSAQRRANVANGPPRSGLQDDRRFSP
ncbi:hypothetical protein LMG27952_02266 [Paraburkholderia hiiakae]|uniref:Transposase InsH N-terminal domain-containing protein n=1 Tax=Paraburkholderia hiiakae TaxID=1081782 RepID=A0ABN7HNY6_9BURK|nr:hypothetical protein LMG27952_02266 [Paraburkholderia hiiakae]